MLSRPNLAALEDEDDDEDEPVSMAGSDSTPNA